MEWYYTASTERRGPVDQAEFDALVAAGEINAQSFVWNESMEDWVPFS